MIRKMLFFLALVVGAICAPRLALAQGTVQAATCYQGTTSAWTAYFLNSVFVYPLCNSSGAEAVTLSAGSSSAPQYVIGRDATTPSQQWVIDSNQVLHTGNCGGPLAGNCAGITQANSDGQPAGDVGGVVVPFSFGYNGTSWDRIRKDTYAAGPQWITAGGSATATIAAASAGPNVIKVSAGRLARVIITTAGTTGTDIFYDNASACSGTIIGEIAGTTASAINVAGGVPFTLDMPAANGITECGGTGSAAVTVSYY